MREIVGFKLVIPLCIALHNGIRLLFPDYLWILPRGIVDADIP
jgi:hypothetical protein